MSFFSRIISKASSATVPLAFKQSLFSQSRRTVVSGFSYPAPRALDSIVNYDLFAAEPADAIKEIWTEHHKSLQTCMATVVRASDFDKMKQRASNTPFFAVPVVRESGHFVLLSNYQDKSFLFTYLEDYNRDPNNAPPYLTITAYEELADSKDMVLLRADICALATLTKVDAERLMHQIIQFYSDEENYSYVYAFNKTPRTFDFHESFKAANEMPVYSMPVFDQTE